MDRQPYLTRETKAVMAIGIIGGPVIMLKGATSIADPEYGPVISGIIFVCGFGWIALTVWFWLKYRRLRKMWDERISNIRKH